MAKELTKKKDSELTQLLAEKREALRKIRFGVTGSGTRNVKESVNLRKEIARIRTEQRVRATKA